ncbi:MAG TPA: MotA/TolQ/ExbB proton channel family protein [Longimicrobiales bacterium]|nr:MotA/TolQ/ExbB proton channel family protein [Longimicrobiales bacterium]
MSLTATAAFALLQLPGVEAPDLSFGEQMVQMWEDGGWMMWPLGLCAVVGIIVIVWKLVDLSVKSARTSKVLRQVDALLSEHKVAEALNVARDSNTPAGRILSAGLSRRDEGTDRVMKSIENVGLIEMAQLERGLIILATLANVAPLLGFLGTVIGMIAAFQAIETAGEVEATLVAGGIKIALITTATGLVIAIPINVMHNYFVTRIDRLVIDMEESAQKMIDTLHEMERGAAPVRR